MTRQVTARWAGGQAASVDLGGTHLRIGHDAALPDGSAAPLPTEVLLASLASCFTIALAFAAGKRGSDLPDLAVQVSADYDGPRICDIDIRVTSSADPSLVAELIPPAERLCYVSNTLRRPPHITVGATAPPP